MWNVKRFDSSDENVFKYVFTKSDAVAEAVLYKYDSFEERTVICCSVMSGCPVGCRFCGTGEYFIRNLTWREITDQIEYVLRNMNVNYYAHSIKKFQIMFMSMGEPMYNFKEVEKAMIYLNGKYPNADLLLSTTCPKGGKYDDLNRVSKEIDKIGLQFSIHESNDYDRMNLIPTATITGLKAIAEIGDKWAKETGRRPFFNYCVHSGNSSENNALELLGLFDPHVWECTLSVICEKEENVASSIERQLDMITRFSSMLLNFGFNVRTFNPAGQDDIGGGCGQLWFVQEWVKNNSQCVHKNVLTNPCKEV